MKTEGARRLVRAILLGLAATLLVRPAEAAEEAKAGPEPRVVLIIGPGQGTAQPLRKGCARTGGGNLRVTQPLPDTIAVTMTGVTVARGHPFKESVASFHIALAQGFEVVFNDPKVKEARLIMWGRTIGLLRSHCPCGQNSEAEITTPGQAAIHFGPADILSLELPSRAVKAGEDLSIHDREGPVWVPAVPGKYTLHQTFGITATHGKCLFSKPASAEFAPDPALEEDWIDKKEPFHGANKKDLGFQVILKVVAEEERPEKKEKE